MKRLRSYARMRKVSAKVKAGAEDFQAVYREVDERSEGRCEVTRVALVALGAERTEVGERCKRAGVEHHHLYRPRRSNHTAAQIVHVCRSCHEHTEYPYQRGRLCYVGIMGRAFLFAVRYAASKFEARGQG